MFIHVAEWSPWQWENHHDIPHDRQIPWPFPGCYAPGCVAASRRASNGVRRMRKRTARRGPYGRYWPMAVGFGQNLVCFPKDFGHPPIFVVFWLLRFDWSPSRNQTLFLLEIPPFTSMIFRELNLYLQAIIRPGTFDYQRVCIIMYQVLINYCRSTENWFDTWISRRVWDLTDMHHFWRPRGTQNFAIWGHVSVQTWPYDSLWILAIDVGILTILNSCELKSVWNARWIIDNHCVWAVLETNWQNTAHIKM